MSWTTDKPTMPGFYWYRPIGDGTPHVRHLNAQLMDTWSQESVEELSGEWAGPLEVPV